MKIPFDTVKKSWTYEQSYLIPFWYVFLKKEAKISRKKLFYQ